MDVMVMLDQPHGRVVSEDPVEGEITQEIRILRQIIDDSTERLRALGKERELRRRQVALEEAYPGWTKDDS